MPSTSTIKADVRRREILWDLVAQATHEAVCEATGGGGEGRCTYYAAFGAALAYAAFGTQYHVQAGLLRLRPDPDDPGLAVELGFDEHGFNYGSFHCWLAGPLNGGRFELVDLSSRHYQHLVENLPSVQSQGRHGDMLATVAVHAGYRWRRPAPPLCLRRVVLDGHPWPADDWVYLGCNRGHVEAVQGTAAALVEEHRPIVVRHFGRLREASQPRPAGEKEG